MNVLRSRKKMFLYACSAIGVNLLNIIMGSYLCSALLVGGFGADAIKNQTFEGIDLVIPALWAAFALVAKIIDGVIEGLITCDTVGFEDYPCELTMIRWKTQNIQLPL